MNRGLGENRRAQTSKQSSSFERRSRANPPPAILPSVTAFRGPGSVTFRRGEHRAAQISVICAAAGERKADVQAGGEETRKASRDGHGTVDAAFETGIVSYPDCKKNEIVNENKRIPGR